MLLQQLRSFYYLHQPYDMERLVEYFGVFGGIDVMVDIDAPIEEQIEKQILDHYGHFYNAIAELVLDEKVHYRLLRAFAKGDRRMHSAFKRARLSNEKGGSALAFLQNAGILEIEFSREQPPVKLHPKQKLKREVARHRISHKMRFSAPFLRFWFYFVTPHHENIQRGDYSAFFEYFAKHRQSFSGLVFEEISNLLLQHHFKEDAIIDTGSYWDRHVEIDLLARTRSGKNIVGECKWTNHKVNKSELGKLHDKCEKIGLESDIIVLFSKRGFSNELYSLQNDALLLFSADDIERLLQGVGDADRIRGVVGVN